MKHTTRWIAACAAMAALNFTPATAAVVTFESVPLAPDSYWNGSDASGGITLDGVTFQNHYDTTYDSWAGFALSNTTDTTTPGWNNQYSAYAGGGAGGSASYAVGYYSTYDLASNVTLATLTNLAGLGASFTNTTYAALSMRDGDGYAKNFGGIDGNDPDWFKLTIKGYASGALTGTVNFFLADYRFADNALDYIVHDWRYVDFSPLGSVDELRFTMTSSDNNAGGIKTPAYFAMDNFLAIPEPSSLLLALSGLGFLARRKR